MSKMKEKDKTINVGMQSGHPKGHQRMNRADEAKRTGTSVPGRGNRIWEAS
jgi:hypothetical protein